MGSPDIPGRLKAHVKTLMSTNFTNEITYQFDSAWDLYLRDMVAALSLAMDNYNGAFETAKQVELEAQQALERGLFWFGIVTSLTASWLSAFIQYRTKTVLTKGFGATQDSFGPNGYQIGRRFFGGRDQVASKVFGDSAKLLLDLGAKWGLSQIGLEPFRPPDGARVANAPNLRMFENNLHKEMASQKQAILKNVDTFANAVEKDVRWGERMLEALFKQDPHLKTANAFVVETKGQELVNKEVNGLRTLWTQDSFYFGFDPPPVFVEKLANHIEREQWVDWLIDSRKLFIEMTMTERFSRWLDSLLEHMFYVGIPSMTALQAEGEAREDGLLGLVKWATEYRKGHPADMKAHEGIQRSLTPIENWTRP